MYPLVAETGIPSGYVNSIVSRSGSLEFTSIFQPLSPITDWIPDELGNEFFFHNLSTDSLQLNDSPVS